MAIKNSVTNVSELYDINRELNDMTRELNYRTQLHATRNAAESQLIELHTAEQSQRQAEQMEIIAWIENEVINSLKGQVSSIEREGRVLYLYS